MAKLMLQFLFRLPVIVICQAYNLLWIAIIGLILAPFIIEVYPNGHFSRNSDRFMKTLGMVYEIDGRPGEVSLFHGIAKIPPANIEVNSNALPPIYKSGETYLSYFGYARFLASWFNLNHFGELTSSNHDSLLKRSASQLRKDCESLSWKTIENEENALLGKCRSRTGKFHYRLLAVYSESGYASVLEYRFEEGKGDNHEEKAKAYFETFLNRIPEPEPKIDF